jgi:peptidylprolyl isomerase
MQKTIIVLCLCLLGTQAQAAPTDIVARAGTLSMTGADVTNLIDSLDATTRARVLANPNGLADLVRDRLTTEALLAEANTKNWAAHPDVALRIQQARDGVVLQSYLATVAKPDPGYPTDALVQTTYDANKSQFVIPRQYHLAQLVLPIAASQKDGGARAAADLHRRAAGSDRAFANAAKQPGVAETDLGWVAENRLQPKIRDAVAGLQVGGLSDPMRLADGFHIFRLVATKPAGTAALADVRPQIVAALQRQKADTNARAYIAALQGRQHVQINEIALSAAVPK